jgi:hypothetical protein
MTRLIEVSNSNSNSNIINYRNKKAYDKRLREKAMETRMKIDFAKGIKTLNVAKVEAALRRGYRPTPQTQNRAYNDLWRQYATMNGNSPSTKKAIAMYTVLIKYKLEPDDPLGFVYQYLTEDRQLPTPILRKMVSTWRIFETEDDIDLSNMLYMTIGERTVEINKLANVKMLLDMFKTHGKRPVVVDGVKIKAFLKKKVKFLLANLPRTVLQNNVDFSGSLGEISRKQDRIQYLQTLDDRGIDLRQVILETKTPEELGIILNRIGNEYAKSGVLYEYVSTGNPKMTKFLLQRGMDPNSSRRDLDDILARYVGDRGEWLSPLRIAIDRRNIKDLRMFKKKGIVVTPELRRYLERHDVVQYNPIYKLLIPPTRPPRMRKVTLVSSFNTIDPVSLTPIPLNQAMIYHGNTRLSTTPNTQKEKVRWVFHPNTINGMRHSAMHPMTRLPLNHSKATKLMPLLRKSDQKRYMTKWARDVAANQ